MAKPTDNTRTTPLSNMGTTMTYYKCSSCGADATIRVRDIAPGASSYPFGKWRQEQVRDCSDYRNCGESEVLS